MKLQLALEHASRLADVCTGARRILAVHLLYRKVWLNTCT